MWIFKMLEFVLIQLLLSPLILTLCLMVYVRVKNWVVFKPIVAIMYVYDVIFNVTVGSVMFWQLPFGYSYYTGGRCLALSDRIQNIVTAYQYRGTWRYWLAYRLGLFINAIDQDHIKEI